MKKSETPNHCVINADIINIECSHFNLENSRAFGLNKREIFYFLINEKIGRLLNDFAEP